MPPFTLNQIPGFSDIADSNFAAEQYAMGLNFQRTVDNAKFGMIRPEIFTGRYINGETVPLPTSTVDGYTYQREELTYLYHFALTGGTTVSANGAPSASGAIRYLNAVVNQLTGVVTTNVEYLVANGSGPTITSDGTLVVFTIATRRLTSLTVATTPVFATVNDTEVAEDYAVTESLMQRINRNAKAAALRAEVIYLGEFVNGQAVPAITSPVDGYVYNQSSEVIFHYAWRWTTQGASLTDPTDNNLKQIQDLSVSIVTIGTTPPTSTVETEVVFYNSGNYPTTYGRIVLFAFCQRNVSGALGGIVDFTDLTLDYLASGRPCRADVLAVQLQNIRYSMCRPEFFVYDPLTNGEYVPLPTSPLDGYTYKRAELAYVYEYSNTSSGGHPSQIRIGSWSCNVNQGSGLVSSEITRVQDGGGFVTTYDGWVRVVCIATRDYVSTYDQAYEYDGSGNGGSDLSALLNPGFDNWLSPTNQTADNWTDTYQTGAGYGAQAPPIVGNFSQRLGIGTSSTPQTGIAAGGSTVYPAAHSMTVLSSRITTVSGVRYFLSFQMRPSAALTFGLTVTVRLYDAIGDSVYFVLKYDAEAIPAGVSQGTYWFETPTDGDTTVATNYGGGSVPIFIAPTVTGTLGTAGAMSFIPTSMRLEFYYDGALNTYVDVDDVLLINQVNPSVGQVASLGSGSLAFFPGIAFTVTDTTFTPDLDFTIQRADGTTVTVAQGSGTTVTGLTQSTTYAWYPYYDEIQKTVLSLQTGGVGTPPWLQTTPTQALYAAWYSISNLPLAGSPIGVTTLATLTGGGSPPPSGGSGGGGYGSGDDGSGGGYVTV